MDKDFFVSSSRQEEQIHGDKILPHSALSLQYIHAAPV